MGHVQKRAEGRWLATYHDPAGRRRSQSFGRKIDAERFLATVTVDVLAGKWVDPSAGRVTLGTYARQWIDERPVRTSTRTRYRSFLKQLDELDGVPLGNLRPSTMRTWQQRLTERVAPSTAKVIRGVVAAILNDAARDRLIESSPLAGVPTPRKVTRELVRPYPAGRVLALRDSITPRLSASIVVGAGAGLRRGEAMGLTVDRVDFLRRTITVDRQLVEARAGRPVFGPPKTAASVRVVPVSSSVVDEIAAHLARYGAGPDGLVFTAPRGGPVTRTKMGAAWRDAEVRVWARARGLALGRDGRVPAAVLDAWTVEHPDGHGHRFHDLRHFYASLLIADGQSVKVVQARLGHASAQETLDTYAHLWPDDEDRSRAAVDAVFARSAEPDAREI